MEMNSELEFQVDEQYENEKGVFTVVSIHRDQMVIRWEDGEEIRTDVQLQRTIQERRLLEQIQREAKENPQKPGISSGKKKGFNGFMPSEFKNSGSGTSWRGRTRLGGALVQKLPDDSFNFNTWAFANKPELHCQDNQHRQEGAVGSVRFFVRLDRESLKYGFCAPRQKDDGTFWPNWEALTDWFNQDESERLLKMLVTENKLAIFGRSYSGTTVLTASNEQWLIDGNGKTQHPVGTTADFLEILSQNGAVDLEITRTLDKAAAISKGASIVDDISGLFIELMPLYSAVVNRYRTN